MADGVNASASPHVFLNMNDERTAEDAGVSHGEHSLLYRDSPSLWPSPWPLLADMHTAMTLMHVVVLIQPAEG